MNNNVINVKETVLCNFSIKINVHVILIINAYNYVKFKIVKIIIIIVLNLLVIEMNIFVVNLIIYVNSNVMYKNVKIIVN